MSVTEQLRDTAAKLVARGKGILAIDESTGTCNKRFEKLGIEPSTENRRAYRELLLTAPGLSEFISGAILYDETIKQSTREDVPFVEVMSAAGMLPGIKVDTGTVAMAASPEEKVTEGFEGLQERIAAYYGLGARFAKWRAVISIGEGLPTQACIRVNAHRLARYAAECQQGGLVPIVEPEVLMDGPHTISQCYDVTSGVWDAVFKELHGHGVLLDAMVFKCSMVISGQACPEQAGISTVAQLTLACLLQNVPERIAGIAFLSGGQGDRLATEHLNRINEIGGDAPWPLTFSYGRALQHPAIEIWRGDPLRERAAQEALVHRARCNAAAATGSYSPAMELPAPVIA